MFKINRIFINILSTVTFGLMILFSLIGFVSNCIDYSTFSFDAFMLFVVLSCLFGLAILGCWLNKREMLLVGSLVGISFYSIYSLISTSQMFYIFGNLGGVQSGWIYVISVLLTFFAAFGVVALFSLFLLRVYFKKSLFNNSIFILSIASLAAVATAFIFVILSIANNFQGANEVFFVMNLGLLVLALNLSFIVLFPDSFKVVK